jgi:hypothetical protein
MQPLMKRLIIADTVTIRREVLRILRDQILSREIGPGERLIEAKIGKGEDADQEQSPSGPERGQ